MTTTLTPAQTLAPADLKALEDAVARLEGRSFAMTLAAKAGMPVEALLRMLPERTHQAVGRAVERALAACLKVALHFDQSEHGSPVSRRSHVAVTALTGAAGGFFGLAGLAVELPVTTTVMLHSIAGIARANGEDLSNPEAALACMQVLALGPDGSGRGEGLHTIESAYYASRAALAQVTREAASYVATKGISKEGAPVLLSFLSKIAARFGLEVSEKVAAQLIPVAGAAGGLALNIVFTQHFQSVAEGHFTVRRLERQYGPATIHAAYESLRAALPA